jgi:hypothetical protein
MQQPAVITQSECDIYTHPACMCIVSEASIVTLYQSVYTVWPPARKTYCLLCLGFCLVPSSSTSLATSEQTQIYAKSIKIRESHRKRKLNSFITCRVHGNRCHCGLVDTASLRRLLASSGAASLDAPPCVAVHIHLLIVTRLAKFTATSCSLVRPLNRILPARSCARGTYGHRDPHRCEIVPCLAFDVIW